MGAQYTADEINAAIARLMKEDKQKPFPDYLNDEIDQKRFLDLAEQALKQTGEDIWNDYTLLQQCGTHKVIAMVSVMRLMDIQP